MGPYRVVVADPPWRFGDRLPGPKRGAAKHYAVMALADVETFLPLLVEARQVTLTADAVLFMWRVAAMVPEAYRVVEAWGFEAKSEIVWSKRTRSGRRAFGMGHYVRMAHEVCIVARRIGSRVPERLARNVPSVFDAGVGRHSAKPECFFDLVERLYEGPYLELFARRHRPGWRCLGSELPPGPAEATSQKPAPAEDADPLGDSAQQ